MRLVIKRLVDAGDLAKERVVLIASADLDIGKYQVADTKAISDGVSSTIKRVFWLPDKRVKAKDTVVLYTKQGSPNEKKNQDQTTSHFFYWGLDEPIWTPGRAAVLIQVSDWSVKRVDE